MYDPTAHLKALTRELFPVKTTPAQVRAQAGGVMAWVDVLWPEDFDDEAASDGLHVRVLLFEVDEDGEGYAVLNIQEQHVGLPDELAESPAERVDAYMRAWASVLGRCLTHPEVDLWRPQDTCSHEVLRMPSLRTREDFERALSTQGRLGAWLTWVQS